MRISDWSSDVCSSDLWTLPAALGVRKACPGREIVAISGDYDFQFMIEELAVGAQFKLPYIHVVVNNAYLGLIRQAQRGFDMDYNVQLSFENVNAPDLGQYGVDHVTVAEGLGCKAIRVKSPNEFKEAFDRARELMRSEEHTSELQSLMRISYAVFCLTKN